MLLDLILLVFLEKISLVVAVLGLGLTVFAFIRRLEWLLGLLLLGLPLFDLLQLSPSGNSILTLLLRCLFIPGWLFAFASRSRSPLPGGMEQGSLSTSILKPVFTHQATITLIFLAAWIWIGLNWTGSPIYGAGKAKSFMVGNLFFYFGITTLWPLWAHRENLDRLIKAGILFGALVTVIGLLVAIGLGPERLIGTVGLHLGRSEARLVWLGTNPIWLARIMATWSILVLWAVQRRLVPVIPGVLMVLVSFGLIIQTGSRGPLAALLLCPLSLIFLPWKRQVKIPLPLFRSALFFPAQNHANFRRRLMLSITIICLLVICLALFLPVEQKARLASVVLRSSVGSIITSGGLGEGIAQSLDSGLLGDASARLRLNLIETCLDQLYYSLPWGAGAGGFSYAVFLRDFRIYPHNIFIELLFENGLPGLILFLIFLLVIWRSAWRLRRRGYDQVTWLWVLVSMMLINAQVSGDLTLNSDIWFWGALIVAAEIYCTKQRSVV